VGPGEKGMKEHIYYEAISALNCSLNGRSETVRGKIAQRGKTGGVERKDEF